MCLFCIGNGVGKQGRGNQPPYRRYGPDTEIQYRLRKPHGLAKPSRILSKREADTEFQYRPRIVDTDIDCGRHFCGRHFRDSYVPFQPLQEEPISGSILAILTKIGWKRAKTANNRPRNRLLRAGFHRKGGGVCGWMVKSQSYPERRKLTN